MPRKADPSQRSTDDGDVMVGCLYCKTGAVQEPHETPDGWFYVPETGWACPEHALVGAARAFEDEQERRQALEVKLAAAESARDENARQLPDLRDAHRRILQIHDDLLTGDRAMADKMAFEARLALRKAGVSV